MSTPTITKARLNAYYMIYYSILMVVVLFGGLVLFLNYSGQNTPEPDIAFAQILRYVLLALSPAGIAAGHYIFKQMLAPVDVEFTLIDKMNRLQTATLIRSACMEMPALLGAVAAFITGDNSFLLFAAVIAVLFILWRPTLLTIAEDLKLSEEETSVLENLQG